MPIKKIEIFGDSILRGAVCDNSGRLKLRRDSSYSYLSGMGYEVRNNARIGSTIVKGTEMLNRHIDECGSDTLVILGFGGNDCNFDWKDVSDRSDENHDPKVSLDYFADLYRKAIAYIKSRRAAVAVCNLVPLDSEKFLNWISREGSESSILHWLGDRSMLYRWHENYNRMVESIARETGCLLINIRESFLTRHDYKRLMGPDGIHPTEEGYSIIDSVMKECLQS